MFYKRCNFLFKSGLKLSMVIKDIFVLTLVQYYQILLVVVEIVLSETDNMWRKTLSLRNNEIRPV